MTEMNKSSGSSVSSNCTDSENFSVGSGGSDQGDHVHEKVELKLIADHANRKLSIFHYLGVGLWLGWFSFYAYLPIPVILLWWYCKPVLALFVVALITSHFAPLDHKLQPKVRFITS
jgi:hypothetical protein